jgi:hypothetical protein
VYGSDIIIYINICMYMRLSMDYLILVQSMNDHDPKHASALLPIRVAALHR